MLNMQLGDGGGGGGGGTFIFYVRTNLVLADLWCNYDNILAQSH